MLTVTVRSGYRVLALATFVMLAGCSAKPVLHEFPPPFSEQLRPPSAVSYTLREDEADSGDWALRGSQGDVVGGFRWRPAFRSTDVADTAPDRSEDFRRDDRFQDGMNGRDYIFRVGATSDSLGSSMSWGTAPPQVTIFDASTGEHVGQLELRTGFESRFEGTWRGRPVLWRATVLPAGVVPRKNSDDNIDDHYPAAQLLEWNGGSTAGLRVYSGRAVSGEPPAFAEPLFDVTAGRPLTRRELGDAVVLLFAIRALEQAAGAVNTLGDM